MKQLLEYLPILKAANNTKKKLSIFKNLVRKTFHKFLKILLDLIISLKIGIDLLINNESIWFYSRISIIIADWLKVSTFCLIYKFFNFKLSYHFCLVIRDNLVNINLLSSNIKSRTYQNIYNYLKKNTEKSVCIESVHNFFWSIL